MKARGVWQVAFCAWWLAVFTSSEAAAQQPAPTAIQPRNLKFPPQEFPGTTVFRLSVMKWAAPKDNPRSGKPTVTYTVDVRHHSQQLSADDPIWSLRFEPWGLAPRNLLGSCGAWVVKDKGWFVAGHVRQVNPVSTHEDSLEVLPINGASALVQPIDGVPLELLSPKLPARKYITDRATLEVLREEDGAGVIMVAVINIRGQERVQITQKWKHGECWWREYLREINGRKDLQARFDSVLTTTQASREKALRADPNAFLSWDKRLTAKVTLVQDNPTFAELAAVIRKGTGVTLTVAESLRDYQPRFGSCSFANAPAWVLVRFVARYGYHHSCWEEHEGGLRLQPPTPMTDAVLHNLPGLEYRTTLHLFQTQVTDRGLKSLWGRIHLTELDLANTRITDAGLKELAGLTNLTTLDLEGTRVTDAGLKELVGLKKLVWLNLYRTPVTDAALVEMRKALPSCNLVR